MISFRPSAEAWSGRKFLKTDYDMYLLSGRRRKSFGG